MKSEAFIGLMSGTSLDAIDAVLADFSSNPGKILTTTSLPITPKLKTELHNLSSARDNEINQLGRVDVQFGQLLADAVLALLTKAGIDKNQIKAIGSHGQTIRHQPDGATPFTLQIGDPNVIAELTGITTVADFRRRDIAAGGQGAPLVPAFHRELLQSATQDRVIVNIGGIANITLLPHNCDKPISGFDTGPGNTLFDVWIHHHLQKTHDLNGEWSSQGVVNEPLLAQFLADPYFAKKPPKSTGREYFNLTWLQQFAIQPLPPQDVQATLVALTAKSIIEAINAHCQQPQEILICGGGVHNQALMQTLVQVAGDHQVFSTEKYGIDPDWVEALAFAWLAKQTLAHQPGNLTAVTGAKRPVVLGGVYY